MWKKSPDLGALLGYGLICLGFYSEADRAMEKASKPDASKEVLRKRTMATWIWSAPDITRYKMPVIIWFANSPDITSLLAIIILYGFFMVFSTRDHQISLETRKILYGRPRNARLNLNSASSWRIWWRCTHLELLPLSFCKTWIYTKYDGYDGCMMLKYV